MWSDQPSSVSTYLSNKRLPWICPIRLDKKWLQNMGSFFSCQLTDIQFFKKKKISPENLEKINVFEDNFKGISFMDSACVKQVKNSSSALLLFSFS